MSSETPWLQGITNRPTPPTSPKTRSRSGSPSPDPKRLGFRWERESIPSEGVTGSGKTEIYLRALELALKLGRRGLALVPEISLTPQTVQRFSARFPEQVAVLHSRLSPVRGSTNGGVSTMATWRSHRPEKRPLRPPTDLGLIVLDEEHDSSYKQSEPAPRYHAREAALELARLTGAVVILGARRRTSPLPTAPQQASLNSWNFRDAFARGPRTRPSPGSTWWT